ncbi:MAG: FtsW/RodA/SpoVE family cell cycle protein, partial [Candidatus Margulisbacteria bacterium]|nr:FtsW/RodA/SpoVE family cell cycle protein [Candidatus Margulisiibacteriota bacterium]
MAKTSRIDFTFLSLVCGLVSMGVIMSFSTSSVVGLSAYQDSYYFIKKHMAYLFIGMIFLGVGIVIPHKLYKKMVLPGSMLAIGCLAVTLIPGIGGSVGGADRWLDLGIIRFQPVEVVKFFLAVFLATSLEHKKNTLDQFSKGMMPILIFVAIPILFLAMQPDLGNIILILGVAFMVMFISEIRLLHIGLCMVMGLVTIIINLAVYPYQWLRIKTFLSPWEDPLGRSYHIIQSFIAIGSGGLYGLGLGQSKLKYFYLPLHYSDFI